MSPSDLKTSQPVPNLYARLGTLEAAWIGRVPNLPNLPNLFPPPHTSGRARTPACTRAHPQRFYVGKVRKVGKSKEGRGFQPSQPLPNLTEVRNP